MTRVFPLCLDKGPAEPQVSIRLIMELAPASSKSAIRVENQRGWEQHVRCCENQHVRAHQGGRTSGCRRFQKLDAELFYLLDRGQIDCPQTLYCTAKWWRRECVRKSQAEVAGQSRFGSVTGPVPPRFYRRRSSGPPLRLQPTDAGQCAGQVKHLTARN